MLLDSIVHAKDDMKIRSLLEAKTEANQVLLAAEKFIKKNAELLSAEEAAGMQALMTALKQATASDDKDLIQVKMDELNEYSRPFAHKVMDAVIGEAMKGKKV